MRRLILAVLALASLLGEPAFSQEVGPPAAPDSKGPQPPMTAWNGSFTQSIPIEVPDFRGIEPKLSLSYDSARGVRNIPGAGGILGIGWTLNGLSVIERVSGAAITEAVGTADKSGGRGVGAYGAVGLPADRFTLDGAELVPCTALANATTSPSCTATGNYAPRIETYQRIKHTTANRWDITAADGTLYRYESRRARHSPIPSAGVSPR